MAYRNPQLRSICVDLILETDRSANGSSNQLELEYLLGQTGFQIKSVISQDPTLRTSPLLSHFTFPSWAACEIYAF